MANFYNDTRNIFFAFIIFSHVILLIDCKYHHQFFRIKWLSKYLCLCHYTKLMTVYYYFSFWHVNYLFASKCNEKLLNIYIYSLVCFFQCCLYYFYYNIYHCVFCIKNKIIWKNEIYIIKEECCSNEHFKCCS